MKEKAFLNFKIEIEKIDPTSDSFQSLTIEEKKTLLIEIIDHNQLYINLSEIEDQDYAIDEATKAFNHSFYEGGEE
ncbi:hypothetical protein EQV77_17830 [Halobacillus fulvus]|nr:hypothetical protein EQV77_17830 [Halobacillus fulvus]